MTRLWQLLRLAAALAIGHTLITVTDSAPWYSGRLQSLILTNQDIFVGLSLVMISGLALWRGGYHGGVQSEGRLPLLELVEVGVLLVALTAFFGLGLSPLSMCFGGGEGFTCYTTLQTFLRGIFGLMLIVAGEEMFFVVYVTTELNRILGEGAAAVALSALIYSTSHLPILQVEGFGSIYSLWFLQILVGTGSLIACYWFSGKNLAAVILLHAYWDGIGAIVLFPDAGVFSPILLILGQLSLPAAVMVVTHRVSISRLAAQGQMLGRAGAPEVPPAL